MILMDKYRIEQMVVKTYESGPREGQWREFKLPAGTLILDSRHSFNYDFGETMTIYYAAPV